MRIIIVGCGAISVDLMRVILQTTNSAVYYGEPTPDIKELVHEIKNYHDGMGDFMYKITDIHDDKEDWILPKIKPLYSQVLSRRPINNPIAGRCY